MSWGWINKEEGEWWTGLRSIEDFQVQFAFRGISFCPKSKFITIVLPMYTQWVSPSRKGWCHLKWMGRSREGFTFISADHQEDHIISVLRHFNLFSITGNAFLLHEPWESHPLLPLPYILQVHCLRWWIPWDWRFQGRQSPPVSGFLHQWYIFGVLRSCTYHSIVYAGEYNGAPGRHPAGSNSLFQTTF